MERFFYSGLLWITLDWSGLLWIAAKFRNVLRNNCRVQKDTFLQQGGLAVSGGCASSPRPPQKRIFTVTRLQPACRLGFLVFLRLHPTVTLWLRSQSGFQKTRKSVAEIGQFIDFD